MIGKSYDGTLANGVAATGVEGLTTIVPISAISQWYEYSRTGGIRHNTNYPGNSLGNTRHQPGPAARCAPPSRTFMNDDDGDEHGDVNQFWFERDHLKDVDKVNASVFITHGSRTTTCASTTRRMWWEALEARGVPLKMWITRTGHEDPFEFRRVALGRHAAPLVRPLAPGPRQRDHGRAEGRRRDRQGRLRDCLRLAGAGLGAHRRLPPGHRPGSAGAFGLSSGGATDTLSWTDAAQNENTMINNPLGSQTIRRVFLSPRLKTDLRISGTPVIDIEASVDTHADQPRRDRSSSTARPRRSPAPATASRPSSPESADLLGRVAAPTTAPATSRCSSRRAHRTSGASRRASSTPRNRDSLFANLASPITVGPKYRFTLARPSRTTTCSRPATRSGSILVGNYTAFGSVAGTASAHGDARHQDEQGAAPDRRRGGRGGRLRRVRGGHRGARRSARSRTSRPRPRASTGERSTTRCRR